MRVWVNGRVLDEPDQAAISVTDHAFTVGDAVFEAVKVLDGVPFALTRHLRRLERSAAGLGLPAPDLGVVREAVTTVLTDQDLPLGRVRITWSGGVAPMGSGRGDRALAAPTLAVAAGALAPHPPTTGVVTAPWPRNERGALAGLKTTSYAENVMALDHAAERGATEAVFANLAGHLCEGTGSNVFYVADGELRTPTLAAGCLAGVTRALVLEWYGAREVDEPIEVARDADEVFLVSTTRDVQAVSRWDDRELSAPGPVTQEVAATWRRKEADDPDP